MIDGNGNVCCDTCRQPLNVGDYPFCPHGRPESGIMIVQDEIPGGVVLENYGPDPVKFYSHTERRAYMEAHGLQEKEKFCPMPGTDIDPAGIPNPAGYMDPQTLENARALVSYRPKKDPEFDGVKSGVLRNITSGTLTDRDARAIERGDPRRSSRLWRRTSGNQ